MFSLAVGFVMLMCKRAASTQRETASSSEGPDDKRPKWLGPDEEV